MLILAFGLDRTRSFDVKQASTTNLTGMKGRCLYLNPLGVFLCDQALQLAGPGPDLALEEFCTGPWSVLQLLWMVSDSSCAFKSWWKQQDM